MKKLIFTTAVLFIMNLSCVHAQRMLKGQTGIEASAGTYFDGKIGNHYYFNAGLIVNSHNGSYRFLEAEYDKAQKQNGRDIIHRDSYTAEVGSGFLLWSDYRRIIVLNAGISAVAGYEITKTVPGVYIDDVFIIPDRHRFVFGAGSRISAGFYLSDYFVLLLQGRGRLLWGTTGDRFNSSLSTGLRVYF